MLAIVDSQFTTGGVADNFYNVSGKSDRSLTSFSDTYRAVQLVAIHRASLDYPPPPLGFFLTAQTHWRHVIPGDYQF